MAIPVSATRRLSETQVLAKPVVVIVGPTAVGKSRIAVEVAKAFETEVLTASIRHPLHVLEAAKAGSHIATMPFAVFDKLISHPLTDLGVARFLEDYRKIPK